MSKRALVLFLLLASGVVFRDDLENWYKRFAEKLPTVGEWTTDLGQLQKQIKTPAPLRSDADDPAAFLTIGGVLRYTNEMRKAQGLSILTMNQKLNSAASLKVQDMFAKAYFAHVGPDGKSAEDWARTSEYEFIAIGENLALGNFKNDQILVQAWMESPGHRENILKASYQEIGIGVKKGVFEGKTVWLAVQIFGKPLSACPSPDRVLKAEIETNQQALASLRSEIDQKKAEVENTHPKKDPEYEQKVDEYNKLVDQYNALVGETKILAEQYNRQVAEFNECAAQ